MIKSSWHPATADIEFVLIDCGTDSFIGEPVDDLKTIELVVGFGRSGSASKYRKWAVKAMQSFVDDFGV